MKNTAGKGNVYSPDFTVLVNKKHPVDPGFIDTVELVTVPSVYEGVSARVEKTALAAYNELVSLLKKEGVEIAIDSAYRSILQQKQILKELAEKYGEEYVKKYGAEPGTSEHHTGLAIDIVPKAGGRWVVTNAEMMQQTEIFKTIHAHLPGCGFILRYPPGKEAVTGLNYEPWHIRYVGREAAREMVKKGLTLEEYLEK